MNGSNPATQAGVLFAGRSAATVAEVIAPLVIVRLLGKTDVGILTALLLVYTTLSMVLTAGLPGTLSFHLPLRPGPERRAVASSMLRLLLYLGGAAALVQIALAALDYAGLFQPDLKLIYLAALIGLPFGDIPMRMLPNMLVIEGRDRPAAALPVIRSIGLTFGTLIPLALGSNVWTVMVVLSFVGLGFLAITMTYYRLVYSGETVVSSPLSAFELMKFSIPVGLTELVSNLNSRFDRFLIIPLGMIAYAEYGAGSWQIPLIPGITYAVGVAYAPRFAELFKAGSPREAVEIWRAQAIKTALIVVPIALFFAVAAEETIELLFTSEYLNGASVFRLYALMTMGRITAFGSILIAAGRPDYVFRSALIAFGSNVVISVPLVLLMGFNGPALGTLLAFIPMVCGYTWYIGRTAGVPFSQVFPLLDFARTVGVAAIPAAAAVAFKLFVDGPLVMKLTAEAVIVLGGFALAGTLLKLIGREEWTFAKEFVQLKLFWKRSG